MLSGAICFESSYAHHKLVLSPIGTLVFYTQNLSYQHSQPLNKSHTFDTSIIDTSMKLEALQNVILFQLDQTSKMAKQHSQRELDQLNIEITVEQWIILKVIHEKPGLSQMELAAETYRDPASITRTLDLLQKKKLVARKPVRLNKRAYSLELTTEGDYFILQNTPLIAEMRQKALRGFSKSEAETLSAMLKKIQGNYK